MEKRKEAGRGREKDGEADKDERKGQKNKTETRESINVEKEDQWRPVKELTGQIRIQQKKTRYSGG